jgi:hypothetical protein
VKRSQILLVLSRYVRADVYIEEGLIQYDFTEFLETQTEDSRHRFAHNNDDGNQMSAR